MHKIDVILNLIAMYCDPRWPGLYTQTYSRLAVHRDALVQPADAYASTPDLMAGQIMRFIETNQDRPDWTKGVNL